MGARTRRLTWFFEEVLPHWLGIPIEVRYGRVVRRTKELQRPPQIWLGYGVEEADLVISPVIHPVFQDGAFYRVRTTDWVEWQGYTWLFPVRQGMLPFDWAAQAFYFFSFHWEQDPQFQELAQSETPWTNAQECLMAMLRYPVVDMSVFLVRQKLGIAQTQDNRRVYGLLTVDVDLPFAFRGKSLLFLFTTLLRYVWYEGVSVAGARLREALIARRDPFDQLDQLQSLPIHRVFLHIAPEEMGSAPNWVYAPWWKEWVERFPVGWHVSRRAHHSWQALLQELTEWLTLFGACPRWVRFHELRVRYPDTLHWLEHLGIQEEWSCGWNRQIGFRAGCASPFQPYDLLQERPFRLWIHPFAAMDRALYRWAQGSVARARSLLEKCWVHARRWRYPLVWLWHHHTLTGKEAGWAGWEELIPWLCPERIEANTQPGA